MTTVKPLSASEYQVEMIVDANIVDNRKMELSALMQVVQGFAVNPATADVTYPVIELIQAMAQAQPAEISPKSDVSMI